METVERSSVPHHHVLVVGAGAMGSLIAARLALAGHDTLLTSRPSTHLERIRREGVTVEEAGRTRTVRVRVIDRPSEAGEADLAVVLVKTWATVEALRPLRPWLRPEIPVLSLQNGLGNEERLREGLGRERPGPVVLGVTAVGAQRGAPGQVRVAGSGPTVIGRPGLPADATVRGLAALLTGAGLPTAAVGDIERWVWRKLAVNAAINGLTALAEVPNGAIADDPGLSAAARALAREVGSVAAALGHDLGDAEAAVDEVARATATNHSSMWRDLRAGNRTEVDAIHGAVVRVGEAVGVDAPANRVVAALIRARERRQALSGSQGGGDG